MRIWILVFLFLIDAIAVGVTAPAEPLRYVSDVTVTDGIAIGNLASLKSDDSSVYNVTEEAVGTFACSNRNSDQAYDNHSGGANPVRVAGYQILCTTSGS